MLQCYSAEWNECRPSFPTHCLTQHDCNNDLLAQEWMAMPNPDIENPIPNSLRSTVLCTGVARGGVAQWDFLWQVSSFEKFSFEIYKHSWILVLKYANILENVIQFCVTLRDIWRRTMLMRRTIYWEPCLAPERCGSFKSTWTCPSGNLQHSWDRKDKDKVMSIRKCSTSMHCIVNKGKIPVK